MYHWKLYSQVSFKPYQEKTESSSILSTTYRGVEKWLTHQIHALEIGGSNPPPAPRQSGDKTLDSLDRQTNSVVRTDPIKESLVYKLYSGVRTTPLRVRQSK